MSDSSSISEISLSSSSAEPLYKRNIEYVYYAQPYDDSYDILFLRALELLGMLMNNQNTIDLRSIIIAYNRFMRNATDYINRLIKINNDIIINNASSISFIELQVPEKSFYFRNNTVNGIINDIRKKFNSMHDMLSRIKGIYTNITEIQKLEEVQNNLRRRLGF
jgi:hypothetical protein